MDLFRIDWKSSSENDLRKIDRKYITKILIAVESLSDNPFPKQSKKLKDSKATYRYRVGDYRIIYQVNLQNKIVTIYHVRHRKDAYKK